MPKYCKDCWSCAAPETDDGDYMCKIATDPVTGEWVPCYEARGLRKNLFYDGDGTPCTVSGARWVERKVAFRRWEPGVDGRLRNIDVEMSATSIYKEYCNLVEKQREFTIERQRLDDIIAERDELKKRLAEVTAGYEWEIKQRETAEARYNNRRKERKK